MWLSFCIVLIVLGALLVALKGVFGRFPDNWEWVGIVLAVLGLAMGAPSVFQMIIGRPKLMFDFDRVVSNQERALAVFLKNPPLDKESYWRKLGVRRDTIESLTASFRISEVGTGKIVIPIMHALIYSDDNPTDVGKNRIALPPTLSFETSIMIAMWDASKGETIVPGDRLRQPVRLSAGVYRIDVIFVVDGDPKKEFKQFIVGNAADGLVWVKPA